MDKKGYPWGTNPIGVARKCGFDITLGGDAFKNQKNLQYRTIVNIPDRTVSVNPTMTNAAQVTSTIFGGVASGIEGLALGKEEYKIGDKFTEAPAVFIGLGGLVVAEEARGVSPSAAFLFGASIGLNPAAHGITSNATDAALKIQQSPNQFQTCVDVLELPAAAENFLCSKQSVVQQPTYTPDKYVLQLNPQ